MATQLCNLSGHALACDTRAVAGLSHHRLMNTNRWIEFELAVASLGDALRIRIRDVEDRWVAWSRSARRRGGPGGTARQALMGARPFGAHTTAAVMAEPAMFGVSARLLGAAAD